MNYFSQIFKNAAQQSKLLPEYYSITSKIGMTGAGVSLIIFVYFAVVVSGALGYEGGRPIEGVVNILLAGALTMLLGIGSAFIGFFLVAGGFSLLMLLKGEFNINEAWAYAIFSRFPSRWFGEKP